MNAFQNLTLTKQDKRTTQDPTIERRSKLAAKLAEQLAMIEAELAGKEYKKTKTVYIDNEDGGRERVERPTTVRRWYWEDSSQFFLQLRYGARVLSLGKSNNAITVATKDELINAIKVCVEAANAGEFDVAIKEALDKRKKK
jgi:hypothetical protein